MSRIEEFERGDAIEVPLHRIEAELQALWRQAAGGKERPVTRACLWNLIVHVGADDFRTTKQLVDELSRTVPARVIILHAEPEAKEQPVRAWVEANWQKHEGGQLFASGSDEVTLLAAGAAVERLPSLVRALLVTDAPTAMLWLSAPPDEAGSMRELLREIDRLIIDTRKLPGEAGLVAYDALAQGLPELEMVDCAWLGVRPLRGQCAALFDRDPQKLEALDRVRVISGVRGCQSRGLLTLGWLSAQLGWSAFVSEKPEPEVRRWHATRRGGGEVSIALETRLGGESHGVRGIELEAGGERFALTRENQCMEARAPGERPRLQPVRQHTDVDLAVSGLGPRGKDPIFREALACAVALVSAP